MPVGGNHALHCAALLLALCMGLATPVHAIGVVDRAEIRMADKYTDIEIKFNVPININVYAPLAHGELLQVSVELPSDTVVGNGVHLGSTEWIAGAQPSAQTLYEYLRFDRQREPNQGRLVVKFLRDVEYSVYKSSDSRSVIISVLTSALPKQRQSKLAGTPMSLPEMDAPPRIVILDTKVEPLAPLPAEKLLTDSAASSAARAAQIAPVAPAVLVELPPAELPPPLQISPTRNEMPAESQLPIAAATASDSGAKKSKADGWRVYGGVSQYYRNTDIKISRSGGDPRFNETTSQTAQSDLRTNLDLSARYRDEDWDMRSRFNGGYIVDFLDHSHSTGSSRYYGNRALLSDAYVDVRNHRTDLSAKVGRQYSSTGGVLGRFDGAQVGVPVFEGVRMNVVAGSPVDLTSDKTVDDTNTVFYGANFDFAPAGSKWQYNVYTLQETIDSITDRRAVGAETRYFGEGRSLFATLDYDVEYKELNRTLLIGNWTYAKKTLFNVSLDYGYSPTLTTRNALISQPDYSSIKALLQTYTESEIKQMARDRTARSRNTLLSATQEFTPTLQLYGSVGQYYFGSTPASAGVEAMPSTGNEYDYELQLIGNGWFQENDTHSLGVRYYDGNQVQRSAIGVDSRLLFGSFYVAPRFWIELRKTIRDGTEEWVYRPGLRMEYSFLRRYHVELDASSDIYKGKIPSVGNQDIVGNFLMIGYRIDLGQ